MTKHTPTEQHRCEKIIGSASWRGTRCSKKAKVEEGGKWYCGTHSTEAEAKRRRRSNERWQAREARWKAQRIKEQYERACVAAFHSSDGREIKTEKIEKGLFWQMHGLVDWTAQHDCECENNAEFMCVPCEARALLAKLSAA